MDVSEEKRLVRKFYLISLVLNVFIPLTASFIIVGDRTGEVQFLYIGAIFWAVINTLSYCAYFLIPGFESKRDKIATLFFPSILLLGLCVVELNFIYFLTYTLIQNLVFFFWWTQKRKL